MQTVSLFIILIGFAGKTMFAQQPRLMLPLGHSAPILKTAFSPDAKKIVTLSADKTIKIWETASGKLLTNLAGHNDDITDFAISPDGKRLASICYDQQLRIWDLSTGKLLISNKEEETIFSTIAFSPDGKTIVFTADNKIKIRDAVRGTLLQVLEGHADFVINARFSPDGKKLATFSADTAVKLWNVQTGKLLFSLAGHSAPVNCSSFSPDGSMLITAANDKTAKTWNLNTGKLVLDINGHTQGVSTAFFAKNGRSVFTESYDGQIRHWDLITGKRIRTITGKGFGQQGYLSLAGNELLLVQRPGQALEQVNVHTGKTIVQYSTSNETISDLLFSTDGKKLLIIPATVATPAMVKVYQVPGGQLLNILKSNVTDIYAAGYDPSGSKLITQLTGTVLVWSRATGKPMFALKDHINVMNSAVSFSPDGTKLIGASLKKTVRLWDALTGTVVLDLEGHTENLTSTAFSDNGKKIMSVGWDKTVKTWDIDKKEALATISGTTFYTGSFSPGGENISVVSSNDSVVTYNAADGKLLNGISLRDIAFPSTSVYTNKVSYTAEGKYYFTGIGYKAVRQIRAFDGTATRDFGHNGAKISGIFISPGGGKLITTARDQLRAWDISSGEFLFELNADGNEFAQVAFSPDNSKIATGFADGSVRICESDDGKLLQELKGHTDYISSISFSPDGKELLTGSKDFMCKRWDLLQDKPIVSFLPLGEDDFLQILPSNYYWGTAAASKLLHYVTSDLKVISFEQLDVKYNRPDKVLEALGNKDTALIKSYRKAYEKRIQKLGVDTTAFRNGYSVPEADFANRDNIVYEQKKEQLSLRVKGMDNSYQLDRFNIWVNEVPVFGRRGISVRSKNKHVLDTTVMIKLSTGENRIETSITNINGTESYRMPLYVNYYPAVKEKEAMRFIGIGIDKFSNADYNLQYSAKDIRDLSKKLKEKFGNALTIDTLFNENVSAGNVKALKKELLGTKVNDKVIIAYSGHGLLSKEYDYYLSTYTVNFELPEQNGLPYEELESLLDSIPARKKLLLIDACHSGEVDKEELVRLNASPDSLIKGLKPVAYKEGGHVGLTNSFDLMQSLFVNVGKSTGATIISAAAGTQFALERNDLKNGVFTFSILEALNKYPGLRISELKKIVGKRVEQLTKGLQKPTSRNETITTDWSLW